MSQLNDRMTEQICRQWKRTKRHQIHRPDLAETGNSRHVIIMQFDFRVPGMVINRVQKIADSTALMLRTTLQLQQTRYHCASR